MLKTLITVARSVTGVPCCRKVEHAPASAKTNITGGEPSDAGWCFFTAPLWPKPAKCVPDQCESRRNALASFLGYESASKFAAAFKKVHGFTPSQFRKSFGLYSR
ncbi:helix-turn-helix domain-containing protein [Sporomusa termitida]|uniref:helix-turn-helix domain-containing protein n=1 Tax=Sporomusa termitida TaxID=2377 RepID=UPI001FE9A851|nr:AraC family transcriptional regulator [Sporomusa termitida]